MNILYIGDVMAQPGVDVVEQILPDLRKKRNIDLVIAQAENVTEGRSMSPSDMQKLLSLGVDFFAGGNHTPKRKELHPLLKDSKSPVIGPANMPECPGKGWKYIETSHGKVLVISLLGGTVGTKVTYDNPLQAIDAILEENTGVQRVATIVNFHGDLSSEKRVIGYYLDGKVTAVIGDHWHVPSADAMVLPNGTGHITDVGMCGTLHSSLGVKLDVIIERWRNETVNRNIIETDGPRQFNALLIRVEHNLAAQVEQIQQIIP